MPRRAGIAWHGAKAVYLYLDIDVMDVGVVPGTGCPELGGRLLGVDRPTGQDDVDPARGRVGPLPAGQGRIRLSARP
jgi:hypothetical protein